MLAGLAFAHLLGISKACLFLQIFLEVYGQILTAMFFFEIVMIALLAIKRSFAAILVISLLIGLWNIPF